MTHEERRGTEWWLQAPTVTKKASQIQKTRASVHGISNPRTDAYLKNCQDVLFLCRLGLASGGELALEGAGVLEVFAVGYGEAVGTVEGR